MGEHIPANSDFEEPTYNGSVQQYDDGKFVNTYC